jgi:hypothetical protein
MKEPNARMEGTDPNTSMSDDQNDHCTTIEMESPDTSQVGKKSKQKISARDVSLSTGILDFVSPCWITETIPFQILQRWSTDRNPLASSARV